MGPGESGQSSSDGGLGKTTAEMTDLDLGDNCFYWANWDFVDSTANGTDDYWNQGNDRNDNYPYLAWQYPSDELGLSGYCSIPNINPAFWEWNRGRSIQDSKYRKFILVITK